MHLSNDSLSAFLFLFTFFFLNKSSHLISCSVELYGVCLLYTSSDRLIHKLRFKTFSSIGIPEIPTFEQFQKSLNDFVIEPPSIHSKIPKLLNFMNTELESAKSALSTIIQTIETGETDDSPVSTGTKHVKEPALQWYKSMLNSTVALSVNASVLKTKLSEDLKSHDLHATYDVELKFTPNGCYYFPLLTISPKKARNALPHTT